MVLLPRSVLFRVPDALPDHVAVLTEIMAMIAADIDAVMILISGSHAEMAIAAAQAGKHVFVEKPLCRARRRPTRCTTWRSTSSCRAPSQAPS